MTILLVLAVLVVLIVVHEFGHFLAAKFFRVKVEEFGVGYPPRAFRLGKWGGTEYTLNWIPFGGFVRLFGDEGEKEHGPGSYVDARRSVQALILVAGVAANALLAWALFSGALVAGIPRVVPEPSEHTKLVVSYVVPGSPAESAGISAGDELLSLTEGENTLLARAPEDVVAFVAERPGEALDVTYLHASATTTATLRPANAVLEGAEGRPAIGVALALVSDEALSLPQAITEGFVETGHAFVAVGSGLWTLARDAAMGSPDISGIVGPVGLVGVVGDAAEHGLGNLLALSAFISVNLVIINLIPIPALDGGRLFLLGVETIMRRAAPRLAVRLLNAFGIALIVFLMVAVTYNDIARLFS
jgi:regulator of sigma E protease